MNPTLPRTISSHLCLNTFLKFQLLQELLFLFATLKMERKVYKKKAMIYENQSTCKIQIRLTLSSFRPILHCIRSSAGHLEAAIGHECNTCVLVCVRRRPDANMSCLTHQPEPPRLSGTNAAYVPLSSHCSAPSS